MPKLKTDLLPALPVLETHFQGKIFLFMWSNSCPDFCYVMEGQSAVLHSLCGLAPSRIHSEFICWNQLHVECRDSLSIHEKNVWRRSGWWHSSGLHNSLVVKSLWWWCDAASSLWDYNPCAGDVLFLEILPQLMVDILKISIAPLKVKFC